MSGRVIAPGRRGFLCLDSHPAGCARSVTEQADAVRRPGLPEADGPVALVVGSSGGYGLAATIAGLARAGIRGIGVCSERAVTDRRTASAGWYRTAATAELARRKGRELVFVNGDAFADAVKEQVVDLLARRFGGRLDYLVYAVAAPRRTDPVTSTTYTSTLKPLGHAHTTKILRIDTDEVLTVDSQRLEPAGSGETEQTVAVMGGGDWQRWIDHLAARQLLAEGFTTTALSYVGPPLLAPIYRHGTIGAAKAHLEDTASLMDRRLGDAFGGRAFATVNGAAVTQSSTAIPGIALYLALLRGVLGEALVPPVDQMAQLWDGLNGLHSLETDHAGRVRLDSWELATDVQSAVEQRWEAVTTENLAELADTNWLRSQARQLFGFGLPGINYAEPVEVGTPWPTSTGD